MYLDETIRRMVTTTRSTMNDLAYMLIYEGAEAVIKAKNETSEAEKAKLKTYSDDRFTKARNVLKLMEEKLPAKACPYSIMQGMTIAQTWDFLGQYTGLEADKEHTLDLLEAEIMHYGQYARYYQSLDSSLYNRLTRDDYYIDQRYVGTMIYLLNDLSKERADAVTKRLIDEGVNVTRSLNFLTNSHKAAEEVAAEEMPEEEAVADSTDQMVQW